MSGPGLLDSLISVLENDKVQNLMDETGKFIYNDGITSINLWPLAIVGLLLLFLLGPLVSLIPTLSDTLIGLLFPTEIAGPSYHAPSYGAPSSSYDEPDDGYGAPNTGYGPPSNFKRGFEEEDEDDVKEAVDGYFQSNSDSFSSDFKFRSLEASKPLLSLLTNAGKKLLE